MLVDLVVVVRRLDAARLVSCHFDSLVLVVGGQEKSENLNAKLLGEFEQRKRLAGLKDDGLHAILKQVRVDELEWFRGFQLENVNMTILCVFLQSGM